MPRTGRRVAGPDPVPRTAAHIAPVPHRREPCAGGPRPPTRRASGELARPDPVPVACGSVTPVTGS